MKKNNIMNESWDFEIIKKCPLTYCGVNETIQESLIPFGFECNAGWKEPLWKASCAIEALNLTYWPKYHIRIEATQVKEKFGTLRFYYNVVKDNAWYKRILHDFFRYLNRKLRNINYKTKEVQDKAPYVEHIVEELKTKEAYVKEKYHSKHISNVTVEEKDGKWFKHTYLEHFGTSHYEPTRHKFLYWLNNFSWKTANRLSFFEEEWTAKQQVIGKYMRDQTDEIIRQAEKECYDHCEVCGISIGEHGFSKRCETAGYIRYVCEKCAKKQGGYYMDEAYYENGKCVETKEELEKKRATKYEAAEQKYQAEEDAFQKELQAAREEDIKTGRTMKNETEN